MSRGSSDDGLVDLQPSEFDRTRKGPSVRSAVGLGGVAAVAASFLYDLLVLPSTAPLFDEPFWPFEPWHPTQVDWMLAFSLVVGGYWATGVVRHPRHVRSFVRRLRRDPLACLSFGIVAVVALVGLVGPLVVRPSLDVTASYQPPMFATVGVGVVPDCLGPVVEGRCHGTPRYPLGTTFGGRGVLRYTVAATRTTLVVGFVTAMVIAPIAAAVGTVSAYFGGWVDDVLMRVVELVQVVPPLIVYLLLRFVLLGGSGDMFLFVAVFGLLSWGSVSRLIRNEALSRREELFVTAAETAGGSRRYVIREHLLPNLTPTIATATIHQCSTLVLTEAALSFLELGVPSVRSWGTLIARGTLGTQWGSPIDVWWISLVPVTALALTLSALNVLGDRLDDVLDPREY